MGTGDALCVLYFIQIRAGLSDGEKRFARGWLWVKRGWIALHPMWRLSSPELSLGGFCSVPFLHIQVLLSVPSWYYMQRSLPFLVHKKKGFFFIISFFLFFSCFTCGCSWGRSGKRHGVGWVGRKGGRGSERVCMGGRCVLRGGGSCQGHYNGCHLNDQKGEKHCVKDEFPQLWRAPNNFTTHTHTTALLPSQLSLSVGRDQQKSLQKLAQSGCPWPGCLGTRGTAQAKMQTKPSPPHPSSNDFYPPHFLLLHGNYSF